MSCSVPIVHFYILQVLLQESAALDWDEFITHFLKCAKVGPYKIKYVSTQPRLEGAARRFYFGIPDVDKDCCQKVVNTLLRSN